MGSRRLLIVSVLLLLSEAGVAQTGIRGQVFMPNGAGAQRQIRFTLTTDNGTRNEIFYTDSSGRISIPNINTPYTIIVDGDGESYDTTRQSFIPPHSGNYITIHLRAVTAKPASPPGLVSVDKVDQNVAPQAREAYDSALKLLQAEQFEEALDPLKRAISLHPNYFHAYNDLGVAYMKLTRLDEAATAFTHAIKINGKIYLPQLNLGIVLNRQKKFKEAADLLLKVQTSNADLWKVHSPLIEALIGSQQWALAETALKKAITLDAFDEVDLKVKIGMVLIRQSKFKDAVVVLREAVTARPEHALAHFNLGAAMFHSGNLDDAAVELRRAYELRGSTMAGAQLLLGQVYHQQKDYPKAVEAFQTYLRDLPDAPNRETVTEAIRRLREAMARK